MKKGFCVFLLVALVTGFSVDAYAQTRALSLGEAIQIAVEQSTIVGVSRQNLQTARQNVLANYGRFLPNATVSTYAGRNFIGPTGSVSFDTQGRPVQPSGFDFETYSFSLNSTIQLFDWGVNVKSLSNAKRSAEASQFDLQYAKDVVAALVIREYYYLVRNENLRKVQEEAVEAAERNLQQVEAFFKIGSNTRADVLQARVRLGNTQLALITAKNNEEIARATLSSRLNLPATELYSVDSSLDVVKVDPDLSTEVEYMLAHRPDLLASRKRVQAARDNLTVSQNSRWPTVGAGMSYSWNDRQFPNNANFFRSEYSWGVGVSLNFNIFDRFDSKTRIMTARARGRIAEHNLRQAKLDAVLEVRTLHLGLKEADERMRVSDETVTHAQENLRLSEERYRVGAGTILETIEAGVSLTEAKSSLIQAKIDYLVAKADLLRATGRPVKIE